MKTKFNIGEIFYMKDKHGSLDVNARVEIIARHKCSKDTVVDVLNIDNNRFNNVSVKKLRKKPR